MRFTQSVTRSLAVASVAATVTLGIALAQPTKKPFEPQVGQPGKDVIWVPTPEALVEKMLDLTKLTPNDIHYDLGSGDGRTVIAAAKRGAKAFGVEYNPDMVELSRANAAKENVSDRATFIQGDIFKTDFSQANVITLYLLTSLNAKLRPTILEMRPGTRVASNSFDMGEWRPDTTVNGFEGCQYCTAHYWMVPARVAGTWKLPHGELRLQQRFQVVNGTAAIGGKEVPISNGKLTGAEITFTAGGTQYTGKVDGNSMEGTAGGTAFRATRG
jgi:SAM-dependent methyltransferase